MHMTPTLRLLVPALAAALLAGCGGSAGSAGKPAAQETIANIGSDTMVNLAAAWAEEYGKANPSVSVEVSGGGSGQGVAALINGSCDLANCSRMLEDREKDSLRKARQLEAKEVVVGYDALSIFVHKDNPIEEISVEQLGEIYREGGALTKWSELGITIPGAKGDEIIRVSRQNNSGTYHYFKDAVVGKTSEFKLGSLDMNGSKDAVELIAKTPNSIGFSGMGYLTPNVKHLRVAKAKGEPAVEPTVATTQDKSYPIARPMYMVTAGEPTAAVKKYLDWVLSKAGQDIVVATGYVPAQPQ
jgi:phosphate transport system substrate-binding protein